MENLGERLDEVVEQFNEEETVLLRLIRQGRRTGLIKSRLVRTDFFLGNRFREIMFSTNKIFDLIFEFCMKQIFDSQSIFDE